MVAEHRGSAQKKHLIKGMPVHAVRTQCEGLDVDKYSHPSYLLVVEH